MISEKEKYRRKKLNKNTRYGIYFITEDVLDSYREIETREDLKDLTLPILSRRFTAMIRSSRGELVKDEKYVYNFMDFIKLYIDRETEIIIDEDRNENEVPIDRVYKVEFVSTDEMPDNIKEIQFRRYKKFCEKFGLSKNRREFKESLEDRRERERFEAKQRRNKKA